jgi:acyl-CoA reductase-like NAD-dependent aldehyde dehydrogenase
MERTGCTSHLFRVTLNVCAPLGVTAFRASCEHGRAPAVAENVAAVLDGTTLTQIGHWIGDEEHHSAAQFDVFDPSTGTVYAAASDGGSAEVDAAVQAADRTYRTVWSRLTALQRADLLDSVAQKLASTIATIAATESLDTGKPISLVQRGEAPSVPKELSFYAGAVRSWRDGLHSGPAPGIGLTLRQPYGVVGLIIPFNAPLMVMAEKIGQALAAGNCVVIKPSPLAPASAVALTRLLTAAGLPAGVVNVVQGTGAEAGAALCTHPLVPRISFTGSTAVGAEVLRSGAAQLKRVTLELSGKNACLVFADADLEAACRNAVFSAFWNTGQICTSGSRIFVQDSVLDEFCERFAAAAAELRIGLSADPDTQIGPVISAQHRERVLGLIELGRRELDVLYAGTVPAGLTGWYVAPHVFRVTGSDHRLLREEIFGPVTCITGFADEAEAIARANDSPYGLSSFVWTNDFRRMMRCVRELETGRVWVNTGHTIPPDMTLPPWKMSGLGEEGGLEGLGSFTRAKTANLNTGSAVPGF